MNDKKTHQIQNRLSCRRIISHLHAAIKHSKNYTLLNNTWWMTWAKFLISYYRLSLSHLKIDYDVSLYCSQLSIYCYRTYNQGNMLLSAGTLWFINDFAALHFHTSSQTWILGTKKICLFVLHRRPCFVARPKKGFKK